MLCFQYITRRACDDANVFQIIAGMRCSWPPAGILNKMASTNQTHTHYQTYTRHMRAAAQQKRKPRAMLTFSCHLILLDFVISRLLPGNTCPRSRSPGYQAYRFHNLLKIISRLDLSACVVMCVRQRQLMPGLCVAMRPNDHRGEEGENEVSVWPRVIGKYKLVRRRCQDYRKFYEYSNWWHQRIIFEFQDFINTTFNPNYVKLASYLIFQFDPFNLLLVLRTEIKNLCLPNVFNSSKLNYKLCQFWYSNFIRANSLFAILLRTVQTLRIF